MKSALFIVLVGLVTTSVCYGHCQIPCGIYDDGMRFTLLLEHVETIDKSISEAKRLSEAEDPDYNQLVRWIVNKEHHASEIQSIASDYFLAQRIKEGADHYVESLELLHGIIVYAMKAKQSLDESNVTELERKILEFKELYMGHDH